MNRFLAWLEERIARVRRRLNYPPSRFQHCRTCGGTTAMLREAR